MNSDDLCDSCQRKTDLYLTTAYEMLCAVCLRDQCQYELKDFLEEKKEQEEKNMAMKRIWKDILTDEQLDKKDKK